MDEENIDKEKMNEICYELFQKHYDDFKEATQKYIDALQMDIEARVKSEYLKGILLINLVHMLVAPIICMTLRPAASEAEREDILYSFASRVRFLIKNELEKNKNDD